MEEAEKILSSDTTDDGSSSLSMLVVLLKAQYFYNIGQVCSYTLFRLVAFLAFFLYLPQLCTFQISSGLPHLCGVLTKVSEQKQSKSWYLLHARALQVCSSYLNLDAAQLPQVQRRLITQHGERENLSVFILCESVYCR